jgi:hypothetical protein
METVAVTLTLPAARAGAAAWLVDQPPEACADLLEHAAREADGAEAAERRRHARELAALRDAHAAEVRAVRDECVAMETRLATTCETYRAQLEEARRAGVAAARDARGEVDARVAAARAEGGAEARAAYEALGGMADAGVRAAALATLDPAVDALDAEAARLTAIADDLRALRAELAGKPAAPAAAALLAASLEAAVEGHYLAKKRLPRGVADVRAMLPEDQRAALDRTPPAFFDEAVARVKKAHYLAGCAKRRRAE